ncbi:MAG TPA: hypothetical protein EYN66_00735 [Myxococcales bacterium]|nr:hypothetical protein [Myxococcales bacterium]
MAQDDYYKKMDGLRRSLPHWSTQEGVDPDKDNDEEKLPDLDIEPDVDVATQETEKQRLSKIARQKAQKAAVKSTRVEPSAGERFIKGVFGEEAQSEYAVGPGSAGDKGAPAKGTVRDVNMQIYKPHLQRNVEPEIWDQIKDNPEALSAAAEDAASENYWNVRGAYGVETESGTVDIGAHTWQRNVFKDGSIFFTWPPRNVERESAGDYAPSHYLRQPDKKKD